MNPRFLILFTLIIVSVATTSGNEIGAHVGDVQVFPEEEWNDAPEEFLKAHWNREKLSQAEERWSALSGQGQSTGLMIIHKGYVIREFGDCEKPVACHSVRKSLLSALYGAWIREQKITIDELLATRLDEIPLTEIGGIPETYKAATLRHLLMSSSGNPSPAEYESAKNFEKRSGKPFAAPGERWAYSNWDFNALGTAFNQLSKSDLFTGFEEKIAVPLKMQDFRRSEHTAYRIPDRAEGLLEIPQLIGNDHISPFFVAAMDATEEALLNSMFMATTVDGKNGPVKAVDLEMVKQAVGKRIRAH